MKCTWNETDVWRFHDGEMEASEREAFETHLPTCQSCERELAQTGLIGRTLQEDHATHTQIDPLEGMEDRIMELIQKEGDNVISLPEWRFGWVRALASAAVFVLLLGGVALWRQNQSLVFPGENAPQLTQVDYFYSETESDVIYYDLDESTKVIWVLDSSAENR